MTAATPPLYDAEDWAFLADGLLHAAGYMLRRARTGDRDNSLSAGHVAARLAVGAAGLWKLAAAGKPVPPPDAKHFERVAEVLALARIWAPDPVLSPPSTARWNELFYAIRKEAAAASRPAAPAQAAKAAP